MIRTPSDLWQIHSVVADYVMPTKKLCFALAKNPIDEALVRTLLARIQLAPKQINQLRLDKNYYWFGRACIQRENPSTLLNPHRANVHHRLVRHADEFNQRILPFLTDDTANFDLRQASMIARESKNIFAECTISRLKEEVQAAEKLLTAEMHQMQPLQPIIAVPKGEQPASAEPYSRTSNLTVAEAAKEMRCSPHKVYDHIWSGKLTAIDTSAGQGRKRRYLIERAALELFLKQQTTTPAISKLSRPKRRPTLDDDEVEFYK